MGSDKAFELIVSLGPHVDGFKINHTLWERTSMFTKYEGELFVDLKLWDTPNSVCSVVEMILEKGATMTTISTFNNSEVFQCLHQYSEDIKLLGVTYLTSWNPEEQFQITREMPYIMWRRHIERIKKYGFIKNTGGPGKYRGGLGLIREYEILSDTASLNVRSDKRKFPPHGLFGGKNGSKSYNFINPHSEKRILPVLMTEVEKLKKGDVFSHEMSGGGGYGAPVEREESLVLKDLVEEKIDIRNAEKDYGVAIIQDKDGNFIIDKKRTKILRQQLNVTNSNIIKKLK